MPNPAGTNQFPGGDHEVPYGGVKRQQQLTRDAPMSGAPVSAVNAPRRAQRKAVKGGASRPQTASAPQQPVLAEPPPGALPVPAPSGPEPVVPPSPTDFWRAVAQLPGVSPLAKQYAERVTGGGV